MLTGIRGIMMSDKLCVVGLGYVGLPLAIEFAKKFDVIGFEINEDKVKQFLEGKDPTHEVGDEAVRNTSVKFTSNPKDISKANFIIVAVPTPIDENNIPNLKYVKSASEIVGKNMSKESIVVFESTVYPGVTEEVCLPILEKESGMKLGEFGLGYSPERINPGDKEHRVDTIVKIVSGHDEKTLDKVAEVYSSIIKAGVHKAPSIKVAEAAKVIENIQRDLNIALMNELSIIFEKMDINTKEVIEAASTKWNFHKYTPGLVGGHCFKENQLFFVKVDGEFDIVDAKTLFKLSGKNVEILSFNVDTRESGFRKCVDFSKREYSNLISLRTSTNQILTVTDDHPVIIWEDGFKVKHARDITIRDKLVINTKLPSLKTKDRIDLISHLPKELINKTRVKPISKQFKDYKDKINFKKNTAKKASNSYIGNYMSLKDYLLLEKKKAMPIKRDEIYLVSGRGPSFNQIKAVINLDGNFARLIGYYLSEGCVTKDKSTRVRWTFSGDENYLVKDLYSCIDEMGLKHSLYKSKNDNAQTVKVSSNIFGFLIENILKCGKDSYDAKAPFDIFYSKNRVEMLKGIIRGDGGVSLYLGKRKYKKNGKKYEHEDTSCEVNFFSISKELFHQTVMLLQDYGVTCSFDLKRSLLYIHGHKNLLKMKDMFLGDKKRKIERYFKNKNKFIKSSKYDIKKGFLIVDLKEISKEETDYVYSFEVDKTQTLITDFGIIAHNCIGVDPYYLTYKAEQLGYKPEVILAGRKINDGMHKEFVKRIEKKYGDLKNKRILVLGLAFKPNVPDFRNSRIKHLIDVLNKKGAIVYGHDPYLTEDAKNLFSCKYVDKTTGDYDIIIIGTDHKEYKSQKGERIHG